MLARSIAARLECLHGCVVDKSRHSATAWHIMQIGRHDGSSW